MLANRLSFLWFELTGKCQLSCTHCYADSGPQGSHGTMDVDSWRRVLDDGASMGLKMVQFIGGEPTLHPHLPELVQHALGAGVSVEVFSNLVHVSPKVWSVLEQPGVRIATSFYTDQAAAHEKITKRRGSYLRTKTNIVEVLRRSIPLRVGLVDLSDGQRVDQAREELLELGVTDIRTDRLRHVGRGRQGVQADLGQLCGQCARGKVAVSSDGAVWPCVFSRWMPVGNVMQTALAEILTGQRMADAEQQLEQRFGPLTAKKCVPEMCDPDCGPSCSPSCLPKGDCTPAGGCAPNYG